jgi:hypothetical protein
LIRASSGSALLREVPPFESRVSSVITCLCFLLSGVVTAAGATITYSFVAEVPTNSGPQPGSFVLTVPNFVSGTPLTQFMGNDFNSCSAFLPRFEFHHTRNVHGGPVSFRGDGDPDSHRERGPGTRNAGLGGDFPGGDRFLNQTAE